MKLFSVYYCAYELSDFVLDSGMYPIYFSLNAANAEKFYKGQIKDAKGIIDETPTYIEYSPDDKWCYCYELIELELERDLRYNI